MSLRMSLVKTTGALSTKKDMLQAMPGLISKQKVRLMQSPVHFTTQSCKVADQPFPWLLAAIGKQDYSPFRELVSQICQANEAAFIPLQRVKARDIIPWKQLRVAAMAALSSRPRSVALLSNQLKTNTAANASFPKLCHNRCSNHFLA